MNSSYQTALELFNNQNYQEAENILHVLYQEIPNDPDLTYFFAVIKSKAGKFKEALELLLKVIEVNGQHTEAFYNIALICQNLNRLEDALAFYQKALELNPFLSEAHNNIAIIQKQLGNYEAAEKSFMQAIKSKPNNQNAMSNLGILKLSKKDSRELLEAETYYNNKEYEKALKVLNALYSTNNRDLDVLNLLGMIQFSQKNLTQAIEYYKEILQIDDNSSLAHYSLGVCYQGQDNSDLALKHYTRAVELNPQYVDALNNLGLLYVGLKRFSEAEECYISALNYAPDYFNSIANLGALKVNTDNVQEGIAFFDRALSLALEKDNKDQIAVAYGNIGFAKLRQLDLLNAVKYFNMALELDNTNLLAHYNKGEALLMAGEFEEGWKEYEWRTGRKDFGLRHFNKPFNNMTAIQGKRVLVYAEQGVGDAIQFVRYLPLLKEKGVYIIFECDKSLFGLMRSIEAVDELIERNLTTAPEIEYDYDIPLLSLPLYFNTTINNIPSNVPYLQPETDYLKKWEKIITNSGKLKIGIVWAGSPTHSNDRHRSVKLKRFLSMFSIEGTEFFSLQKGIPILQARDYQLLISNLDEHINSFSDTAAAIAYMDLVITVDTSVAHLAGAMGKPVWVLLPFVPDWRWMLERQDSPWYPTMRIFRQPKLWDWDSVFDLLKAEIIKLIQNNNTSMPVTSSTSRSFDSLQKFLYKIESERYSEIQIELHRNLNREFLTELINKINLPQKAEVLDIKCGKGTALEIFRDSGFNPTGITISDEDVSKCREKGFTVLKMAQSFLDFENNKFDLLWSRNSLEHSIAPYYTLSEYFRILKPGGYTYIEVSAPDTAAHHETNPNNYSILPKSMWLSLIKRCGFNLIDLLDFNQKALGSSDESWGFICNKPMEEYYSHIKNNTLYLALTSGDNFGWGICSKYLRKELAEKVEIKNMEELTGLKDNSNINGTVLHALTNQFFFPLHNVRGKRNIGYTFFESELTEVSVENAKKYDLVIGGSSWNRDKMLEKGIKNVDYLIQGIDPQHFFPGTIPKNNDLFVIFSGGKFELRKGQDLVLKAIQVLQQKYHDVILINSWYNLWPETMDSMAVSKFIKYERKGENWQQFMVNLLRINDIDGNKVFTLPLTPNQKMREVYLRSDIGLFPNRCEGGTNLVLMEYMACGKPVIASFNSGHKDILTPKNSLMLSQMNSLKLYANDSDVIADWEEPNLDELIDKLDYAYNHREEIKKTGEQASEDMKNFTWANTANSLLKMLEQLS